MNKKSTRQSLFLPATVSEKLLPAARRLSMTSILQLPREKQCICKNDDRINTQNRFNKANKNVRNNERNAEYETRDVSNNDA